jgi:corrinoid protein of di/trimethylamine methyltransferase
MGQFLNHCARAVLEGDKALAKDLASKALTERYDILQVIEQGFATGIRQAGELWTKGEYFLPELAFSAEAMKGAMDVLNPALLERAVQDRSRGVVVIGTVQGDIHDIGKTLVATMLAANGYRVIDMGADTQHARFLEEATKHRADVLCMSALLTTTMAGQGEVIELLKKQKQRDSIKVVVGGAPTSAQWAREIGADGYAENAVEAVQVVASLL